MSRSKLPEPIPRVVRTEMEETTMGDASTEIKISGRRFARCPVDAQVQVHVFREGAIVSYWGRSDEMGLDGIGGTFTGELEVGEVVSLDIALPLAAHPVKLRALVRYRKGLRHGFEFLIQNKQQRETIARVCEMLQAK